MRSRPTQDCEYSPGGLGGRVSSAPLPSTWTNGYTQPVENATIREPAKACATSAGTCEFIAQVSDRSPSAPNLRPAMKTMFGVFGSALTAVSSRRSQLMVSTPRACSHSFVPASLKRATPMILRFGSAALARPASVGPILPETPRIMMSPSIVLRSSISAWLGRHSSSSRAARSEIVSGRVSRVSSIVSSIVLLQPDVLHHEQPLEAEHQAVEPDAEQCQQHDRHHHGRRIERGLHLDHQVAEPAVGSDELPDDSAGHGEDGADLHAREDIRQRAGQLDLAEQRPARTAQRFDEVEQVRLDLAQTPRGRQQNGKEADAECDQNVRYDAVAEPHDEQRTERHFGDHVQRH